MASRGLSFQSLSWPVLPVMIPALVHFTLVTLALTVFLSGSLVFSHLILLAAAFWTALDRKRYEPVVCFMVALVVSGIADVVVLALNFNTFTNPFRSNVNAGRFVVAMIIINLLGKPVTLLLSCLALYSRRESFGISFSRNTQSGSAESQPYQAPVTYPQPEYKPEGYGYPPQSGQPASYPPPPPAEYVPQ